MRQIRPQPSSAAAYLPITDRGVPFTSIDGRAFIRLDAPSNRGFTLPIRSRAFRDWFINQACAEFDTLPTAHAFAAILNYLEARASRDPACQRLAIWRRVGARGPGRIPQSLLLDLANPAGQMVEISPGGWTVTDTQGALFETSPSTIQLPAPIPSPNDALETLRSCLNLPSTLDWFRCLAWLLTAMHPLGRFPILILQGPPGSGKSCAARILRSLIDPSTAPLAPTPSSVRHLLDLARHHWILAFDHISAFPPPVAEALCRLSSGVGISAPEELSRRPETLQQYYKRPVLLTVTDRWSCPAGLAARALTVNLPPIPPSALRAECDILTVFEEAFPRILGALCSAAATALGRIAAAPRGSDSRSWAVAASPAFGATEDQMEQAFAPPPPPHPMLAAVRNLLDQRRRWTGTAAQLLDLLQPVAPCQSPKGVSQQLNQCMLTLADAGIELKFRRLHNGRRTIDLRREPGDASFEKSPQDASPDSGPDAQPSTHQELTVV